MIMIKGAIQLMQFKFKIMDCMRCTACRSTYTDFGNERHLPRVLIACGHTACQTCITTCLTNDRVICHQCKKASFAADASSLPINQTLLTLLRSQQIQQQHLCKTHRKKLEAYCEKQKELICVECSLSTHRYHKACLISEKAQTDRAALKESLKKIAQGQEESRKMMQKLASDEACLESCFLDFSMEISMLYKHIIETVSTVQQREEQNLKKQKQAIFKQIQIFKAEAVERQNFHEQLLMLYRQLEDASDIQFLQRENQQSFILSSSKSKRQKCVIPSLEFKRVSSLQEVVGQLQEMLNFEKKKIIHSNSVCLPNKDGPGLHGSPSLKKQTKQPAVLQVNLSEQYNRRKANLPKEIKKPKPAKKVISISTDKQKDKLKQKQKIIEAVALGKSMIGKEGKTDLKFIRESSIKKNRQHDSLFYDELDISQNFMNSFMRTSRDSQPSYVQLNDSSIKHSFNSFSLLQTEQKIFHFGGRTQSNIEKFSKETQISGNLSTSVHLKGAQAIHHRAYHQDKCLIFGGYSNTNNEKTVQIFEFNFKTQKLSKTAFLMPHPLASFGAISKQESIYIVGGKCQKALNTFEKWDLGIKQIQVTKLSSMVQSREDLGCCLGYDGYLYVAGGVNSSNNILNSCERFNWNKKSWETVPHMIRQRRSFVLVALPHGIMAIGGHSSFETLSCVQFLDFNRRQWIELAPLHEARCFHSAIVSRDYQTVTVFGGFADTKELDSIQVYDIDSNTWQNGGKMKENRCWHASILSP